MQLKEEYIRFLVAYKPIAPATVLRLIEDTPRWQQPELRMALEYMGIDIPTKAVIEPKMTLEQLLGYCTPFEIELKDSPEDEYPHFEPKVNFFLTYWLVQPSPGIAIADRKPNKRPINWLIQLPDGKLRLCFEHTEMQLPDEVDVDDSSDELQRVRVYKLI